MQRKNIVEVKKWTASNGNVCFRFSMQKTFKRPWTIISAILLAIVVYSVVAFVWKDYTLLTPLMVTLFLFFLWWTDIPVRRNETIIAKTVHEIMDKVADEDARVAGVKVAKSLVNHDIKGTYGGIEASCFLVLLTNDEIWEYPLLCHKSDKQGVYFECERNHIVSNNQKHIRRINPKRWPRFVNSLKLSEKTCLGLLLVAILVIGGFTFAVFLWIVKNYIWWFLLIFISYVLFYSLIKRLYSKYSSEFLNVIRFVLSLPFAGFYLLLRASSPFITIVGTYFFVALFAFGVPAIILIVLSYLCCFVLKPETIVFVVLAFGSIICSNSYRATKWIIRHDPLRDWGNHSYETYREKLAIYLVHPSNVVFLLYLIYFMFLSISGFLQIECEEYLIYPEFDTAILKAFLVFIAFTNMRAKSKAAKVDARELFLQTMKLFVHDR